VLTSRDARRRRVLVEEVLRTGADQTSPRPRRCAAPRYTPEALAVVQRPLGTLIPRRPWTLWVIALSTLAAAWGIEVLFIWMLEGHMRLSRARLPIFDAKQPASLSGFFQSTCFLVSALYSGLVLAVRAHRLDDFRGRYRVWVWATVAFLLVHLDLACQFHQSLASVWQAASRPVGSDWLGRAWPLAYTAVLGSLLVRLILEVQLRSASGALLASSGGAWMVLLLLYWWPSAAHLGTLGDILTPLLRLLAAWSCAMATILYARHVYLDAQGSLPERTWSWSWPQWPKCRLRLPTGRRRAKDRPAADGKPSDDPPISIPISSRPARPRAEAEPAPRRPRPAPLERPAPAAATDAGAGETGSDDPSGDEEAGRLSRAERRRLKKERRRLKRESA
jgi:hypothetical protein